MPGDDVERLIADATELLGQPLPSTVERAFRAVPRHLFLPDRIWLRDGQGGYQPCERAVDPEGWLAAAYSDAPLVTQFSDGLPTSSASMPSMVLRTLALADLADLDGAPGRVLELGTGTGFSAALLCAAVGDGRVTSVEIDPVLAERAERNLQAVGYAPELVHGDAAAGWPDGAPYARVVATFSVDRVPAAWLEQTEPGGLIVTPWASAWCRYGTLELVVGGDGRSARGRFHAFASFMPMRQSAAAAVDGGGGPATYSTTGLSPWAVAGGDLDVEFHIGLSVPGASFAWDTSGDHAPTRLEVADETSESWATVDYDGRNGDRFAVSQSGPRRLWDEIAVAYDHWEALGRPNVDQYGLSVDVGGEVTIRPR